MGLFGPSQAEKTALEIEKLLEHDLGKAFDLYDNEAIPYLEKWQHSKKRPIDKSYTAAIIEKNVTQRSINLGVLKDMKFADETLRNNGNIEPLVKLGIKSSIAFTKLTKKRKDIDHILIVRARDELSDRMRSHRPNNPDERISHS